MDKRQERIYRLMTEKISGDISANESRLLDQIIAEDAHTAYLWEQMRALHESRGKDFQNNMDENESWNNLRNRLDLNPDVQQQFEYTTGGWQLVSMAAAAIALIVATTYTIFYYNTNNGSVAGITQHATQSTYIQQQENTIQKPDIGGIQLATADGNTYNLSDERKTFTTKEGAVVNIKNGSITFSPPATASSKDLNALKVPAKLNYHIHLSDGTEVWLNSASTLWFPYVFNDHTRDVYIEGEALFKVAKNADRPFIVHTEGTDVKVLGTTFNINTYEKNKVYTSLVEGAVVTYSIKDTMNLNPGDQSIYQEGKKLMKASFNEEELLGWREGIYHFHDAPLSTIMTVASKWYGIDIQFDNTDTRNLTFSGAIDKSQPLKHLLENLQLTSDLQFSIEKEQLRVSLKKNI